MVALTEKFLAAVAGWPVVFEDRKIRAAGRVKAALDLLDDADLQALTGCGEDALARHRVNGTGPTPIRVLRAVFYRRADVVSWLERNRDASSVRKGRAA